MSTVFSVTTATSYPLSQASTSEAFVDEFMAQFEEELGGIASKTGKKSSTNGCMQAVRGTARSILERISSLEGRSKTDLRKLGERAIQDLSALARQQCSSIATAGALVRTDAHIAAFGEYEPTYHFPSQDKLQKCLEKDPGLAQDIYLRELERDPEFVQESFLKEKGVIKAMAASFAGSTEVDAGIELGSFETLRTVNKTLNLPPQTLTKTHKIFVEALKKCAVDPAPAAPAASTHSTAEDLFNSMVQGELAREIRHRFGRPVAVTTKTAAGVPLAEPQQESASLWRDSVVSSAVRVGIGEVVGMAITPVPAYIPIIVAHGAGEMAREVESDVQRFLDTHTAKECAHYGYSSGEDLNPYQGALAARALLQAAQLPSKILHAVHHQLADSAARVLDTIGMTDANAKEALAFVAEHSVEFPVLP